MADFQFKLKRGTANNLMTVNPILLEGEPCFELDTYRLKIGNGLSKYNDLPYVNNMTQEDLTKILKMIIGTANAGEIIVYSEDNSLISSGKKIGGNALSDNPDENTLATEIAVQNAISNSQQKISWDTIA